MGGWGGDDTGGFPPPPLRFAAQVLAPCPTKTALIADTNNKSAVRLALSVPEPHIGDSVLILPTESGYVLMRGKAGV